MEKKSLTHLDRCNQEKNVLKQVSISISLVQLMGEENDEEEEDENLKTEHFDVNNERMEMEI
ncbi:hypothetical protein BLOT_016364 [Blomia tropicalis]|nr:hypothetical protein BLOT_016364 [Blomia tropicalis]